ncbi:Protein MODIFIER OF SNC1 1 [Platanthera zijinensis]|uniref:Protein MODIFIER OF SNC1 1 n=1 Tax=Platanthera zijinensis TaxID=2320716 RepID=A0AAP0G476_9ASPA
MMASSMLTGERRWTSTRKSGMTVLGKVPKPINLPSQKLENHGLDPNVEIVPKGAHTWGTRPLPASSNAWGSSNLSSPRADGSVGSSIHGNGRPLSGGNGTRPSTGSSERSSEPSAISWGPSSRPSSASGIVPNSHALVAANRPRSAETRPNSSQLSRFAESSADVIARGATGNSEKLAAEATRRSNFTLSSGDFPTLGSEKNDEPKSQGYGNLGPTLHGNFNSWSADNSSHTGEDSPAKSENWHKDNHSTQPLLDPNVPIQQFASWHGAPGHPPNVVWYGGHESGGPYRSFGPRDSYHPDPYYPYVPSGALPNTQTFSRAEPIPGGVHFQNNEAYGHMPPESYSAHSQLGIPVRPGVYPGPVLYEGFHGSPHTRFDNSSGQDAPTVGMPVQYGVHNQHLPDNARLQPWRFHVHPDGAGSVMSNQQMISKKGNETQGQYKVLLKQHGSPEEEHNVPVWPTTQRGKVPAFSTPEVDLVNCYKQEQPTDVVHSQESNDLVDHSNRSSTGTCKSTGHNVMEKLDSASVPIRDQHSTILKKNASLMEKIEGLNSKTRVVDVNYEGESFPSKEKVESSQNSKNMSTSQLNPSKKVIIHESVIELKPTPHQSDELSVVPDMSNYLEDGGHSHSYAQKRVRNMKGGVDHHYGKLKFGSYGSDERNDTPGKDSLEKTDVEASKSGSQASQLVSENQDSHLISKSVSEPSSLEFVDDDAQHAKLKELARQRAIELQKKELERTAEQKAKALVKLDELNRRTSATSANSKQNSGRSQPPSKDFLNKHDTNSGKDAKSSLVINETPHELSSFDSLAKSQANDGSITKIGDPGSRPLDQEITPENITERTTSDLQDCGVSRRKQAGYRRRRNITDERKTNSDSSGNTENIGNFNSENSTLQSGNKNNGDTLSKNKLSETQPTPSSTHVEKASEKYDVDHNEIITPAKLVELVPVPEKISDETIGGPVSIQVTKMTSERASNNWKPHSHRKTARNLQSDKAIAKYQGSETVVWAPVKPVNKNGPSEEAHKCGTSEIKSLLDAKNGQDTHNGAKARRAEMERYVPKPIAKELSLQGDFQHSSPPFAHAINTANKPGPASSNAVTSAVSKTVVTSTNTEDTKQNRQGKTRASWRQRNFVESPSHEQGAVEGSPSLESSKFVEKATDREPSKTSDLLAEGDETTTNSLSTFKNHGVNRQRRQQYKEPNVDRLPDKREMHSLGPAESGERNLSRNDNPTAGSGQIRSHWQPKSQVQPQPNQHGYKGNGQRAGEKSLPSEAIEKNLKDDDSTGHANKNKVDDLKYHSSYSGTKATTNDRATKQCLKDENESINRDFSAVTEAASANASSYQDHPGMPRHGQNHSHFAGSQKTRPTSGSAKVDRQFEYQKTGYSAGGETLEAQGVSSGARYGIQGRNQSRRGGHFYGPRRGPAVRTSGAYDIGG